MFVNEKARVDLEMSFDDMGDMGYTYDADKKLWVFSDPDKLNGGGGGGNLYSTYGGGGYRRRGGGGGGGYGSYKYPREGQKSGISGYYGIKPDQEQGAQTRAQIDNPGRFGLVTWKIG
jgi:hypothetical protein